MNSNGMLKYYLKWKNNYLCDFQLSNYVLYQTIFLNQRKQHDTTVVDSN